MYGFWFNSIRFWFISQTIIVGVFFLISNKEVYSKNYLMKTEAEQTIQREKQTEKEKRTRKQAENNKELNTKERTKELDNINMVHMVIHADHYDMLN